MTGPEPGIYEDVDFAEYAKWPYMNGTLLCSGKTPRHMKAVLDGKVEKNDSKDLKFGRAVHVRLCEPDRYEKDVLIADGCCATLSSGGRKGKACGAAGKYHLNGSWWCGKHKMKEATEPADYISQSEAARIEAIAAEVRNNEVVKLLRQKGGFEASAVFDYRGIRMKGRLDKLIPPSSRTFPAIVDIKKTQWGKGGDEDFSKAIRDHNYHVKAALYCELFRFHFGETPNFIWLVIEDDHPFCLNLIQATDKWLEIGKQELDARVDAWKQCVETGEYPGYAREIHFVEAPEWLQIRAGVKDVNTWAN